MKDNTHLVRNSAQLSQPIIEKRKTWNKLKKISLTLFVLSFITKILTVYIKPTGIFALISLLFDFLPFPSLVLLAISTVASITLKGQQTKLIADVDGFQIINSVFPDAGYTPDYGISKEEFLNTHIARNMRDKEFCSKNLIAGTYQNVSFRYSDIEIVDYDSDNDPHTLFKGYLVKFQSDKLFGPYRIQFTSKKASLKPEKDMLKAKTDYPDFDESFRTFLDNESYLSTVITPERLQYITDLLKLDEQVYVCYDGTANSLYVMVNDGFLISVSDENFSMERISDKAVNRLRSIQNHIDILC
ncbi:MAG: DUF3137 domain-containing protein [Oscillospiraceae bacterium]|nr:DUF3137 domain-containing protein [Oscillospiraceae bacterium]